MAILDFIYNRHSVRKYNDTEIASEDILEIIKAATQAPSGCNMQNWHFVVLRNKDKISQLVELIEKENDNFSKTSKDLLLKEKFNKFLRFQTVFKSAPVVILAYFGPYNGIDHDMIMKLFKEKNAPKEEIDYYLQTAPGIQNVSAAMENLVLAASAMGYGTCWATSQNFALKKIESFINLQKEGYRLMAITPLGKPESYEQKSPPRKPIDDVVTFID